APEVAICMATFEPPLDLFRRQVESIRAQSHGDWLCVVSDDCSAPQSFAALREVLAGDPRFVVSRSERRLGVYRNFERALALAALAVGDIAFVDRPLYDYVQHSGATLGHAAANRMTALRPRAGALRRDPRDRVRLWRMHYFVDACRLLQFAAVLRMRCGGRMA